MRKANGVVGWVGAVAAMAVIAAVLWPVTTGDGYRRSPTAACISSIKQTGVGIAIYAADFDDRYPLENWADATREYRKNEELLTCPSVRKEGGKYGYAMNLDMVGAKTTSIAKPEEHILLFETDALGRNVIANLAALLRSPRHTKERPRVTFAFCDTSARAFPIGDPRFYKHEDGAARP